MKESDTESLLVVRRFLPAPREEVFAAWLDPESLALFMRPGEVTGATAELDARVGGKFRILMLHGGAGDEHTGEYLAIEPPKLLSFTWISAATRGLRTVVTVELREKDGGTELTLTHRGLPKPKVGEHEKGWGSIVRNLEGALAAR